MDRILFEGEAAYQYYVVKSIKTDETLTKNQIQDFENQYYNRKEDVRSLFAQNYYQINTTVDPNNNYNIHVITSNKGTGLLENSKLVLPRPMDMIFWLEDNTGDKVSDRVMLCTMGNVLREKLKKQGLLTADSDIIRKMALILNIETDTMVTLFNEGKADVSWALSAADWAGKFLSGTLNSSSFQDAGMMVKVLDTAIEGLAKLKFDPATWLPSDKKNDAEKALDEVGAGAAKAATAILKEVDGTLKSVEALLDQELKRNVIGNKWITDKYHQVLQPAKRFIAEARLALEVVSTIAEVLLKYPLSILKAFLCGLVNGFIEAIIGIISLVKMIFQAGEFLGDIKNKWPPLSEAIDELLDAWDKFKFAEFFKQLKDHIVQFLQEAADEIGDGIDEKTACQVAYFAGNAVGQIIEFILEIVVGALVTGGTGAAASVIKKFVNVFEKSAELLEKLVTTILKIDLKALQKGAVGALKMITEFLTRLGENTAAVFVFMFRELKVMFGIGLKQETIELFEKLGVKYEAAALKPAGLTGSSGDALVIKGRKLIYKGKKIALKSKAEAEEIAEKLRGMELEGQVRYLDELAGIGKVIKLSKKALELLQRYADDALNLWKNINQRPGAVGILEGIFDGKVKTVINYTAKGFSKGKRAAHTHPLVKEWLEKIAEPLLRGRPTHGKCAEVLNISEWLFDAEKALKLKKGSMKIEQAREIFEGVGSKAKSIYNTKRNKLAHALDKSACESCNPMLKHFNIKQIFN